MPSETEVLPGAASPHSDLPESATLKADAPGIDDFFKEDTAPAIPAEVKPRIVLTEAQSVPDLVYEEAPTSLAARLSSKNKPAPVVVAVASAPISAIDPVAEIETQMRASNKSWKPSEGWTKLKEINAQESAKARKLEADLAEAQKKLTTIPATGQFDPEENERLKKELKVFSDELAISRLEAHPDFRRQFIEPKNNELSHAKDLLEAHKIDGKAVDKLLSLPRSELGKAVSELVKDVPAFDQTEVAEAIRKAYALEQSGRQALASSKDILKGMQQQSAARAKQAFESRWAPVSAAVGEHVVKMEVPANATPDQKARAERYNTAIDGLRTKAESIAFSPMDEGGVAENAIKAAAYDLHVGVVQPQLLSEFETLLTNYGKLASELKAIKSRNPNKSIGASPTRQESDSSDPTKMSHADAAAHFFSSPKSP